MHANIHDKCTTENEITPAALEVIFYDEMHYINLRFTYLLYLLTKEQSSTIKQVEQNTHLHIGR